MALCDKSATQLRVLPGSGNISAVELSDSCVARIDAVNPVVVCCFENAYDEAVKVDDDFKAGKPLLPLHEFPLLVKDLADTADVQTTYGSGRY